MRKLFLLCLLAPLACARGPSEKAVAAKAAALMKPHLEILRHGLLKDQRSLQDEEKAVITPALGAVQDLDLRLYLNRYGEVRWAPDAAYIGKTFDAYTKRRPTATDAIEQSFITKTAKARKVKGAGVYEVSLPIVAKGQVVGILFFLAA